jgi:CheY-like chemotaxis protein
VKILIADDDGLSRRLLEKTLEREGYEVIAVDNGRLALQQLSLPDGPRLALLDWMMPELDGTKRLSRGSQAARSTLRSYRPADLKRVETRRCGGTRSRRR